MPRPRFHRLEPEKRQHILDVAASEFAERGFEAASYNRIIERAGLSKGAMYYYFDDKTDLYGTVLRDAIERMMAVISELPPEKNFWRQLEAEAMAVTRFTAEHPQVADLVRSMMNHPQRWGAGPVAEVFELYRSYAKDLINRGQSAGAIRTDLPLSLLVAVTFSLIEAVDRWFLDHLEVLVETPRLATEQITGLFRRLLEPEGE